jgi:MFS family permease
MATAFNVGVAASQNLTSILVLRFFAGMFGSSPITNSGGAVTDMFDAEERGLALTVFSVAPFLGPVLGPIIGGFVGAGAGWRWLMGLLAIMTGSVWIIGTLFVPVSQPQDESTLYYLQLPLYVLMICTRRHIRLYFYVAGR